MNHEDICSVLEDWPHEPGEVAVRRVIGSDGRTKIQMRVDLGILQLEEDGRPDGVRPYGYESLLSYHLDRLRRHRERNGTDLGFELVPSECLELRREASMYYHRYLALFGLGEYEKVKRDTQRNLRVLNLCARYGSAERDRIVLEQFRPFLIMMNTRADVHLAAGQRHWQRAMIFIEDGLAKIRAFFERIGMDRSYKNCPEVKVLRRLRRKIRKRMPENPVKKLSHELNLAVREERYEDAARLRDRIVGLTGQACLSVHRPGR